MTGNGVFSAVRSMARLVTLCLDRKFEMQNKGVRGWSCWLVAVSFMTESEAFHFFWFGAVCGKAVFLRKKKWPRGVFLEPESINQK